MYFHKLLLLFFSVCRFLRSSGTGLSIRHPDVCKHTRVLYYPYPVSKKPVWSLIGLPRKLLISHQLSICTIYLKSSPLNGQKHRLSIQMSNNNNLTITNLALTPNCRIYIVCQSDSRCTQNIQNTEGQIRIICITNDRLGCNDKERRKWEKERRKGLHGQCIHHINRDEMDW